MLSSELQWLERVNTDLNEKLAGAGTSLEAFQLKSAIDEYLVPSLENLRTAGLSVDTPEDASEDAKS
jgi:hypothetical protein